MWRAGPPVLRFYRLIRSPTPDRRDRQAAWLLPKSEIGNPLGPTEWRHVSILRAGHTWRRSTCEVFETEESRVDELINLVSQRTGIAPDKAQIAIQTVVGFLKERLPAPIAAEVDAFMSGNGGGMTGDIGSLAKGIEGMFGNRA